MTRRHGPAPASTSSRLCRPSCGRHRPAQDALRRRAVGHPPLAVDAPFARRRARRRGGLRVAEALDLRPAAAREDAGEARLLPVHDEPPRGRHRAHEVVELRLDRREVREDVGVVVFEIVEYRRARPVVDELRALVEERRVGIVGLDHEERAVGQPRRDAEARAARRRSRIRINPACSRIHASIDAVVVLPCVPATASVHFPASTFSQSHCGPDVWAGRRRGSLRSADCRA